MTHKPLRLTLVLLTLALTMTAFVLQSGNTFFVDATTKYTLTTKTATGGTTSPTGTHSYTSGTSISLTASPSSQYSFSYWSVRNAKGTVVKIQIRTFKLTMNGSYTVTPIFALKHFTLSVINEGGGKVSLADGDHSYAIGTSVTVTATNANGYTFDRWELDSKTVGLSPSTTVSMSASHLLEVHFREAPAKLVTGKTINNLTIVIQSWGGKVSMSGGGHSYTVGSDGVGVYPFKVGTSVTVTATNTAGFTFDHWELDGKTVSMSKSYTVPMSYCHELDAYFYGQ
jgi:hypothetical protein